MRRRRESAGILLHRRREGVLEVLLVHPGGPLWRNKDFGAWTIPKGERPPDEDAETTARREFAEELGPLPEGPLSPLGRVQQRAGKWVEAFALEGDFDPGRLVSNNVEIEWPPRSGKRRSFPEIDRAAWFTLEEARRRINPAQAAFLDEVLRTAGVSPAS
jgi:predicted NUDIX family NTP pyrophosphohydrolase